MAVRLERRARDGGLPWSTAVARVSPRFSSPHVAVWVAVCAAFAVALWAKAYTAMVALSTIALYASYALPIAIGLRARRTSRWTERGPWNLGRWSTVINLIAIVWVAFITVLFVLPPNHLAGTTFAGCLVLLGIGWLAYMRRHFRGPRIGARGTATSDA